MPLRSLTRRVFIPPVAFVQVPIFLGSARGPRLAFSRVEYPYSGSKNVLSRSERDVSVRSVVTSVGILISPNVLALGCRTVKPLALILAFAGSLLELLLFSVLLIILLKVSSNDNF